MITAFVPVIRDLISYELDMGKKHKQKSKNNAEKHVENDNSNYEVSQATEEMLLALLKVEVSETNQEIQGTSSKTHKISIVRRLKRPSKSWFFDTPEYFDKAVKTFCEKLEIYDDVTPLFGYYADLKKFPKTRE
ncbi:hypothetical protein WA026_001098 [Henosepilachna vigintioctopunctata]|uniref:Uncharacterized protein n=1 Tax=Henosepilachna vigintioctopunctata TaxID=420089 RepID=A0AAW1V811_9CUCU